MRYFLLFPFLLLCTTSLIADTFELINPNQKLEKNKTKLVAFKYKNSTAKVKSGDYVHNIQQYIGALNTSEDSLKNKNDFNHYIDIGAGIGPNYGIYGGKMVIGYNGTGIMIGAGSFDGYLTNVIGFQIKYQWIYANISYAAYGSYYSSNSSVGIRKGLITGTVFMIGSQIDLVKNKLFLEVGLGYASGGESKDVFGKIRSEDTVTFGGGLGFRIGQTK